MTYPTPHLIANAASRVLLDATHPLPTQTLVRRVRDRLYTQGCNPTVTMFLTSTEILAAARQSHLIAHVGFVGNLPQAQRDGAGPAERTWALAVRAAAWATEADRRQSAVEAASGRVRIAADALVVWVYVDGIVAAMIRREFLPLGEAEVRAEAIAAEQRSRILDDLLAEV